MNNLIENLTPHEVLFRKLFYLGFPQEFQGFKIIYDFKNYDADIKYNGFLVNKIRILKNLCQSQMAIKI